MTVEEFLHQARHGLDRLTAERADELHRAGAALLVDIRPQANRVAEGEVPGAVVVERIVLEWLLAPDSDHRIPGVDELTHVILFCNEGYASSLAARDLRAVGLPLATN